MVDSHGRQSVPARGSEPGQPGRPTGGDVRTGTGGSVLPDPGLREPGLLGNGWDGGVHQGVGFDERQGFVREINGRFISFSKPMLCTTARPERKTVCVFLHHTLYLRSKGPL